MTRPGNALCGLALLRANSAWRRLCGLLGRRTPPSARAGLWLLPCRAVHTVGMGYAIDVAFIDAEGRVLRLHRNLKPWRVVRCRHAASVVELRGGSAEPTAERIARIEAALRRTTGRSPPAKT